ncbi:RNA polymerase II-associated [Dacryopinax primogenitus]|uniref:RNA polymerase II-associated n=1 Tax=Dacryopinax primogenitus (strain DJM 731) TaxID=1858805 RepID=M5FZP1_DACPD|nr:RNA polymerase II-associated [Dacryopinax primogenitus]EJU03491.1 RNA polymerase II-associated [Dacryopinax primogenitus]
MSRRAKNDLIVRVRYQNPLPEPPCPPKLLNIPTTPARYAQPSFTDTLFDARPFPMVIDSEFGMPLDLSKFPLLWREEEEDPQLNPTQEAVLDERDRFLLEHISANTSGTLSALPNVPWLRQTTYISRESVNRTSSSNAVANAAREGAAQQPVDVSRDRQLRLVEESFAAVTANADLGTLKHPNKPGVTAVEVLDILPDEMTWPTKLDVYRFSERPGDRDIEQPDPRLDSAIIRPMKVEDEDTWLAYYLLADDAAVAAYKSRLAALPEGASEEEMSEFRFVRDYETMKVMEECVSDWLMVLDDGTETGRKPGAYYKNIERRMWLRKRRVRRNDNNNQASRWDAIQLRHAPMQEAELADFREAQAEVQDPEFWTRKALEAEIDAEGEVDVDAEGEVEMEDGEAEHEVEGRGTPMPTDAHPEPNGEI